MLCARPIAFAFLCNQSPLSPIASPGVCADLQEQSEVLYQYALSILPADAGDPEPHDGPQQVEKLTEGVLALAYSALQRALRDAGTVVPARRQQRVMSWLVCFATGMSDIIDGDMAQAAGPRLLKHGAKVLEAIEALQVAASQDPQAAKRAAAARLKLYPAEGAPPLPWVAQPAQPASPAPDPLSESPAPPPLSAAPPTPAPISTPPTLIVEPSSTPPPYVLAVVRRKHAGIVAKNLAPILLGC